MPAILKKVLCGLFSPFSILVKYSSFKNRKMQRFVLTFWCPVMVYFSVLGVAVVGDLGHRGSALVVFEWLSRHLGRLVSPAPGRSFVQGSPGFLVVGKTAVGTGADIFPHPLFLPTDTPYFTLPPPCITKKFFVNNLHFWPRRTEEK